MSKEALEGKNTTGEFIKQNFINLHAPVTEMGFHFVTIYPTVSIGASVKLGNYVTIEDWCSLGDEVLVGNGTIMRPETSIGRRTKVGHLCVFEGQSTIGEDCVIQSQCHITLGATIEDKVFIGPGFIGINDRRICHLRPHMEWNPEPFTIRYGSRIGSGAIILPGVEVGKNCVVGAGSLVTKDVPDNTIVMGNPASIFGMVPEKERL